MGRMIKMLVGAVLTFPFWACAQVFHPFPEGMQSVFFYKGYRNGITADSAWEEIYRDSLALSGNDTVIFLNNQVRSMYPQFPCFENNAYVMNQPGNLGSACVVSANRGYGLVNPYGDTLWIHTRLPVGSFWNARPHLPGFDTARVVQYGFGTLNAIPPDSFVVIEYGGGRRMEISQHYGVRSFDGFVDWVSPEISAGVSLFKLYGPAVCAGLKYGQTRLGKQTAFPSEAFRFSPGFTFVIAEYYYVTQSLQSLSRTLFHIISLESDTGGYYRYKGLKQVAFGSVVPQPLNPVDIVCSAGGSGPDHANDFYWPANELFFSPRGVMNSGTVIGQLINMGQCVLLINTNYGIYDCNGIGYSNHVGLGVVDGSLYLETGIGLVSDRFGYVDQNRLWATYLHCVNNAEGRADNPNCSISNPTEDAVGDQVQLFPNPTTGKVRVKGIRGEALPVRVVDVLGKQVLTREWDGEDGVEVDLSELPDGLYYLRFGEHRAITVELRR